MATTPSFLCLLLFIAATLIAPHSARPIFILGDSTADVGTNNFLTGSNATANFPHNGVDFPHSRPTGRFSNGLNCADTLARKFGLDRSPSPFLFQLTQGSRHFRKNVCKGVNFASGGSGLLDQTGLNLTVVSLSQQIEQFRSVRDNLTAMIGANETEKLLCKSLFFISIGSNDIFAYFNSSSTIPKDEFISTLMSTYSQHITNLHGLGARKFGIVGVSPVGCCPFSRLIQLKLNGNQDCFLPMNDFAQSFHIALGSLLSNISSQLPGMKYSLGDTYNMTFDVIKSPQNYSIDVVDSACCGYGILSAEGPCNATAPLCGDRSKYLFWDKFHPSQRASVMAADALYFGAYTLPISFAQLDVEN